MKQPAILSLLLLSKKSAAISEPDIIFLLQKEQIEIKTSKLHQLKRRCDIGLNKQSCSIPTTTTIQIPLGVFIKQYIGKFGKI